MPLMKDILAYHRIFLNAAIYRPSLLSMSSFLSLISESVTFSFLSIFLFKHKPKPYACLHQHGSVFSSTLPKPTTQRAVPRLPEESLPTCLASNSAAYFLSFSILLLPAVAKISSLTALFFFSSSMKIVLHLLSDPGLNSFIYKTKTHNRDSVFPSNNHNPTITLVYFVM